MKRSILAIIIIFIMTISLPVQVSAKRGCCSWHNGVSGSCRDGMIVCNDGTTSPTCTCEGGSTSSSGTITRSTIYGCTDSNAINYNPNANTSDGSCIARVYGCTNINAFNYNSNANTDDGSCIEKIYGCIDKNANNFNEKANTTDESCLYTKYKTKFQKINYKTKYKYKFFSKKGKVLTKGKKGKKEIKMKYIVDEKGNVVDKVKVSEKVIKKPVTKVVATKDKKK